MIVNKKRKERKRNFNKAEDWERLRRDSFGVSIIQKFSRTDDQREILKLNQ